MYSAPYAADSDSIANTAVKAALLDKLCIDIITRFFSALCYTYQAGNDCIHLCVHVVTYEIHSFESELHFCCFCSL